MKMPIINFIKHKADWPMMKAGVHARAILAAHATIHEVRARHAWRHTLIPENNVAHKVITYSNGSGLQPNWREA